jgi:PKD repeat protein
MHARILTSGLLVLAAFLGASAPTAAQDPATGALVTGKIDLIRIDDRNDPWSSGQMVVGGQVVTLPRNLVIQLPAAWMSLKQLFDDAPPAAFAKGVTGLAALDGPEFQAGLATVLGNRTSFGNLIAGEVFVQKGVEVVNGTVTLVNTDEGYFRIDGIPGDDATGVMVRINDPEGRHTIQGGRGCDGGPNCSPDPRFALDPDNYTVSFVTGYPAGIPSTVPVGLRPGFRAGDDPSARSDAGGVGDPFCPSTNRGVKPVPDSTRFAPIRPGDSLSAEGNFEVVGGVRFLSCHTLSVFDALTTQASPTQPDYMTFAEAEWDVPAFDNQRIRLLLIGFTTLNDSQLDVFSLNVDPRDNTNHELPLASTVNNPHAINQGIVPGNGGIFKFAYDVDFLALIPAARSPCQTLINAGFGARCPQGGTLAENVAVLSPPTREIQARTRHSATLLPGVVTRDVNGRLATNGQYLTPVGIGHPEFVEIDLGALQTPFAFDGVPWSLDRRLSPAGCDGGCESTPQPLEPFPWSGRNPTALMPLGTSQRPFRFFPFRSQDLLAWPPLRPGAIAIGPTPAPGGAGDPLAPPDADFAASVTSGGAPLTVAFTDLSTGIVNARLWSFGDGAFSTERDPVHVYASAGSFDVALTALGFGGQDQLTRTAFVTAGGIGGPGAPEARFGFDRSAGNVPLAVQFSDQSLGEITSWRWNFGDGSLSSARNPSHVYTTGGVFTVTLTVQGPGGTDSVAELDAIVANVPGDLDVNFTGTPLVGPAPLTVRFRATNVSGRALTGTFEFGDGGTAAVGLGNGRATHTYAQPGVYTVTLTAQDLTDTDIEQKVGYVRVTAPLVGK